MIIHHRWLKEGRIAFFEIEGDIEWDDLAQLNQQVEDYLEKSTSSEVHCVFNTPKLGQYPTNVFRVNKVMAFIRHPKMGWLFLVTDNRAINFISTATSQFSKTKYKTLASLDELLPVMSRLGLDIDAGVK